MWYYTLPAKSMRRYKPWPSWNHPKYREVHGRELGADGDEEDYDVEAEIQAFENEMKNEKEEDHPAVQMYACDSIQNCKQQACESLNAEIESHGRGHKILVAFYQTALQVAYHKITGNLKCIDYFQLDCMKQFTPDRKVDDNALMESEKIELAIHLGDADRNFAQEYSIFEIPGYKEMIMSNPSSTCGGNIQNESGDAEVVASSGSDSNVDVAQGVLNNIF